MWFKRLHGNKKSAKGFVTVSVGCYNAPNCKKTIAFDTDTPEEKPPKVLCDYCKEVGAPGERFQYGKGDHNNKHRGSDKVPLSFNGGELVYCNVYSTGQRAFKFWGCS